MLIQFADDLKLGIAAGILNANQGSKAPKADEMID